jgi:maltose O-acetyltransferase
MKSEKEKMLKGELYLASDPALAAERTRVRLLMHQLNNAAYDKPDSIRNLLKQIIPLQGNNLWIEPPFYCDYGSNITVGHNVYLNFNCCILDVCPVLIGDNVLMGPGVQIFTATHPMSSTERAAGHEFGKPVSIGSDVWIGGGSIICPGVHIGNRSVIGAGSVVTRDIAEDSFAAGNPCRIIRRI